jgi:hypothetical protein
LIDLSLFREKVSNNNENKVTLFAHPDRYDYGHEMTIFENGKVEFLSAGDQIIKGKAEGKVAVRYISQDDVFTHVTLYFYDILLLHPYDKNTVFATIEPFVTDMIISGGLDQKDRYRLYEIPYEEQLRVYSTLYEFSKDPVGIFRDNYFKYSDEFYQPENGGFLNMSFNEPEYLYFNQEDFIKMKREEIEANGYDPAMVNSNHGFMIQNKELS